MASGARRGPLRAFYAVVWGVFAGQNMQAEHPRHGRFNPRPRETGDGVYVVGALGGEGAADYVLFDDNGKPLAVVEACASAWTNSSSVPDL